ncbi:hypothetical protein GM921_09565 [Pedobacter sp. LMG 31464]|uniref:Uncharacterized protein n=1 Tax=Pedobacter planticolens TaxID=2679964 RepID=A0A923DZP0_9SPHI|nr:hypothetical protein [Pedobacter planticolens]MBB2145733.1 hypothetical protein [Pedobacter planticolens]
MESIDKDYLKNEIENFKSQFCPYGYLDIQKAVADAIASGHDGDWAFEQVEQFSESCETKIANIDPCYVVMDSILQIARNEIEEISGFDLQNDAGFDVYGNFMGSTYLYKDEDVEKLKAVLSEHPLSLGSLSDSAKYFLSEIEIDVEELINMED